MEQRCVQLDKLGRLGKFQLATGGGCLQRRLGNCARSATISPLPSCVSLPGSGTCYSIAARFYALAFNGAGITNTSGITQNFVAGLATIAFSKQRATAGVNTVFTQQRRRG